MKKWLVRNIIIPILGAMAVIGILAAIAIPSCVGKAPNPKAWCCNNVRWIKNGKEQCAREHSLTNGAVVTVGQISQYMKGEFADLKCAKGGAYSINPIGIDARCSFHGTMNEMYPDD